MERKPKTIFQLDSPFISVQWPRISPQNQETILELLCSLLSPIGQYRSSHATSSKGKRDKKRKRREAKAQDATPTSLPPAPVISSFLAVGLSSITRSLESSSQKSKPKTSSVERTGDGDLRGVEEKGLQPKPGKHDPDDSSIDSPLESYFSAIFVCRSTQPPILNDHLPQLVYTASLAHPEVPATRLVELPRGSDVRLCEALGIPRVSFIGILERSHHSKSLVDLVRECVPEVEVLWLKQAKESKYLPVKINAIETFSTVAKKG